MHMHPYVVFSSFLSYDAVFLTMFLVLLIAEKNMKNYSCVEPCSLCILILFFDFFLILLYANIDFLVFPS
jgi:hypothetical protein